MYLKYISRKLVSCISCQLAFLSIYFYFLCHVCVFSFLFFIRWPACWATPELAACHLKLQLCALYFYTCWWQIKFSLSLVFCSTSTSTRIRTLCTYQNISAYCQLGSLSSKHDEAEPQENWGICLGACRHGPRKHFTHLKCCEVFLCISN